MGCLSFDSNLTHDVCEHLAFANSANNMFDRRRRDTITGLY
jgi:hypothetical protein